MKLLVLLLITITTTSAQKRCKGFNFNDRYYEYEILKNGIYNIHNMVLNRNNNTLFFTLDDIAKVPTRILAYLNLDTRAAGVIDGVRNASSVAVDQSTSTVFVGGDNGIFRINSNMVLESLPVRDRIRSIFFKDKLYFTTRRLEAYQMEQNGFVHPLFELQGYRVEELILDDDNNIFFVNDNMLYRVKLNTRIVNTLERYRVNLFAVDMHFKPYVNTNDGLYVYNKYKYVLDKVSNLVGLKALTFSRRNEPIFAVFDSIYQLNMTTSGCFEIGS